MQMIPPEAGIKARALSVSISGILIPAYAVEYGNEEENFTPSAQL
jgi:hypothetical protein